jgi:hypothetical protein
MAMIRRGGRAWQLLTVAVIALPWLLRDELATRLDTQSNAAAEVQTALHQESERSLQATEQRETRDRLKRIEIMLAKATRETTAADAKEAQADVASESARREAEELVASAETFLGLLEDMPITPQAVDKDDVEDRKPVDKWLGVDSIGAGGLTKAQLQALAEKVAKTAQDVADADNPAEGDFTEWDHATAALHVAYNDLLASAHAEEKASAATANAARWAAWLFTALGALMIGDWSRTGRGRDADAAADGGTQARPDAWDDRKAA